MPEIILKMHERRIWRNMERNNARRYQESVTMTPNVRHLWAGVLLAYPFEPDLVNILRPVLN